MRRLHWDAQASSMPKRPYRDSAILYGVLAILVVVIAWATGGSVATAAVLAGLCFVVATAWSWSRWRVRLREEARRRGAGEAP